MNTNVMTPPEIFCLYLCTVQLMIYLFVFSDAIGRIRVLSVKTALSTLCAGRLVDKLRCKLLFLTKLQYM